MRSQVAMATGGNGLELGRVLAFPGWSCLAWALAGTGTCARHCPEGPHTPRVGPRTALRTPCPPSGWHRGCRPPGWMRLLFPKLQAGIWL